jgi:hypothetical protein
MDYVKKESARVLDPEFKGAREAKQPIAFVTDAGKRYLYRSMTNEELAQEPRSSAVYREMLLRNGLDERLRMEAVEALAKADKAIIDKDQIAERQKQDKDRCQEGIDLKHRNKPIARYMYHPAYISASRIQQRPRSLGRAGGVLPMAAADQSLSRSYSHQSASHPIYRADTTACTDLPSLNWSTRKYVF